MSDKFRGYVQNCLIKTKQDTAGLGIGDCDALFVQDEGHIYPQLDGYAIVPLDE